MQHYDLIVIGSGPAGERGAAQAAYFGKRVAIVERERRLGGAAANTGTLPSKTLRETSLVLSGLRSRNLYGVDLSLRREATVAELMRREKTVNEFECQRISLNMERHNVHVIYGEGSFLDPHTIAVRQEHGEPLLLTAEVILIATGSAPRRLETFCYDSDCVYDSDTILGIPKIPNELIVIGGGVIGCEYACTFAALGTHVTLVDRGTRLMSWLDAELSNALASAMQRLGVTLIMNDETVACEPSEQGLSLTLRSERVLTGDAALVAAGRTSNTQSLNLEAAGVRIAKRGLLEVDESFRTSTPHIYAAGDVIGFPALASTSMEQARLAMVKAFDLGYKEGVAEILPYGLYTIPEVSMAGETEESCKKKGIDYVVGRATYLDNARGTIIGDDDGFLKLIFRRGDMRLLGVHVIGEIASEIVHIGLMGLLTKANADLFIRSCFNYPTLGEMYKYATYDAMGNRQGQADD